MKKIIIIFWFLITSTAFAGLDSAGGKVLNVATPTVGTDGANKQYVDDTTAAAGHNILSVAHGDTVNTGAPSRGSLMVADSTPKWAEVVIGAATTFLKSDGTDAAWDAIDLGTDTNGNYVATIADAGNTTVTVTNSGTENAAVTLDVINVADSDLGDVTISGGTWSVEDDSHNHTGSTLSGIDISDDTNLAVTSPVVLTDDTISWDSTLIDDTTWSDGANASNIWRFDVVGTNHTMTAISGLMIFSHNVTISGNIITNDITCDELTLTSPTQNYIFTDRTASVLLESQTSGLNALFEIRSKDSDGTDSTGFRTYRAGDGITTWDLLDIVANTDDTFLIRTLAQGFSLKPIIIQTGTNDNQLVLATDGDNSMSGSLDVTGTITALDGTDEISMFMSGNDAHINWNDGSLLLATTETNRNSILEIRGDGTGEGVLEIYDEDEAEYVQITPRGGKGIIEVLGTAPAGFDILKEGTGPIDLFDSSDNNVTASFRIYGFFNGDSLRHFDMDGRDVANTFSFNGTYDNLLIKMAVEIDDNLTVNDNTVLGDNAADTHTIEGITTLGDGGATNYTTVEADGDIVQNGTGRTFENSKVKLTAIGGYAIALTNETGANTVQGQLVKADTANNDSVILTAAGDTECIGVFLESGIADGSDAWVVIAGIADVAMGDNEAATRGNWVETNQTEAGYADATGASPAAAPRHFNEIGHCIENVPANGGGTHILARCVLHFN